jgi:hypothetical protein
MTQLVIQLDNEEKAKMLSAFLSELPYVSSVSISGEKPANDADSDDFFALAGLWEGRSISQSSIRKDAWPDRTK